MLRQDRLWLLLLNYHISRINSLLLLQDENMFSHVPNNNEVSI
jgi:hypothetical protein